MPSSLNAVWSAPRPYLHPVVAPNGAVLSVEAPADHPWHHGLWFTIKFVNDDNFWEEYGDFGLLTTRSVVDDGRRTTAVIDWERPHGAGVALTETRTIERVDLDDTSYAIDWTEVLVPNIDVVFDRTPFTTWGGYGGLTLRGAPDFVDTVLRTPGEAHERLLGVRAPWCGIDGAARTAAGVAVDAGLLFLDASSNPNSPVPWYASTRADTYGDGWANFLNAAFLWDGPLTVAAEQELRMRYRVIVHDGHWDDTQCRTAANDWTGT